MTRGCHCRLLLLHAQAHIRLSLQAATAGGSETDSRFHEGASRGGGAAASQGAADAEALHVQDHYGVTSDVSCFTLFGAQAAKAGTSETDPGFMRLPAEEAELQQAKERLTLKHRDLGKLAE